MTEKIIFSVEFTGLSQAEDDLALLTKRQKELRSELNKTKDDEAYLRLSAEMRKATEQANGLRAAIKAQKDEAKGINAATGSYIQLNAELVKLRRSYKELSEAERSGKVGQQMLKDVQALDKQLKSLDATMGQYQRNVGNYKSAFDGFFAGLTRGGTMIAAVTGLTLSMSGGVQAAALYSKSFADLQAILGVTGKEADDLEKKIGELTTITLDGGQVIVNTAAEIATAMKIVGSASPELLKDKDALAAVTKESLILAKASGDELLPSAQALTGAMAQFGLGAEDATRVINALAAGSKVGAAEIPNLTEALKDTGLIAANSGISLEENIALIETLGTKTIFGAEAGTALRNILIKLASAEVLPNKAQEVFEKFGVNVKKVADETVPFNERLKELSKIGLGAAEIAAIFDDRNVTAVQTLLGGIPVYEEFSAAVTGTQTAYEQAAINADSFDQSLTNLKNTLTNIMVGVVNIVVPALSGLINIIREFPDDIGVAVLAMATYQVAMTATATGTTIAATATRLLTLALQALPFVAVAAGAVILYEVVKNLFTETEALTTVTEDLNKAVTQGIANYAREANAADALFDVLRDETKSKEEKKVAVDALNEQYGTYLGNLDLEKATVEQLNTAQNSLNSALIDGIVARIKQNEATKIANELFAAQTQLADAQLRLQKFANDTYLQGLTGATIAGRDLARAQNDAKSAQATINELQGGLGRLNQIGEEFRATLAKTDISVFGTATATKALGDAAVSTGDDIKVAGYKTEKAAKATKDLTTTLAEMEAELAKVKVQLNSYNDANQIPKEVFDRYDSLLKQIADLKARLLEFKGGLMDSEVSITVKTVTEKGEEMQQLAGVTPSPDVAAEIARQDAQAAADARIEVEREMLQVLQDQAISFAISTQEALFQMNEDDIEARKAQELNALEANYSRDIELAGANQAEIQRLTEERDRKRREIERKAFEDRKKNDAAEMAIKGIIAIAQSWVNPGFPGAIVLSAILAAQTAVGVATILNKQFVGEKGLSVLRGGQVRAGTVARGPRHAAGGIDIVANGTPVNIEGGEHTDFDENGHFKVINRNSTSKYGSLLSSIAGKNFRGKGGLMSMINEAGGGIPLAEFGFNAPPRTQGYGSPTVNVVNQAQDLSGLERALMNQRPVLVVKDVNAANQDLATVQVIKDF